MAIDETTLERLIADLESDRVERKRTLADRDKIREAICAFANDLPNHREPGVLFIGANDDGTVADTPITDEFLLTLADMRSDGNILPFPEMTVEKRNIRGGAVAVVMVQPALAPPVRFRGRVWIRVGPRRAVATREEELRLAEKRRGRDLPFDVQSVQGSSLADLDLEGFRQIYLPSAVSPEDLALNNRSIEDQLVSLRLLSGKIFGEATVLGLLLLGKDPRFFLPGAYVQFLRIEGGELGDPVKDQKELSGTLIDQLRALDDLLKINIQVALDMQSALALESPDYPLEALRQLVRNAVLHRTYEGTTAPVRVYWFTDRVEIMSPGGPFGQVNRDNFGRPGLTDYRNPHLAEAMKYLGYVQKFGFGLEIARRRLAENGNPPVEFLVEESRVVATVRGRIK